MPVSQAEKQGEKLQCVSIICFPHFIKCGRAVAAQHLINFRFHEEITVSTMNDNDVISLLSELNWRLCGCERVWLHAYRIRNPSFSGMMGGGGGVVPPALLDESRVPQFYRDAIVACGATQSHMLPHTALGMLRLKY